MVRSSGVPIFRVNMVNMTLHVYSIGQEKALMTMDRCAGFSVSLLA